MELKIPMLPLSPPLPDIAARTSCEMKLAAFMWAIFFPRNSRVYQTSSRMERLTSFRRERKVATHELLLTSFKMEQRPTATVRRQPSYSERQVKSNSIRRRSSVDGVHTLKRGLSQLAHNIHGVRLGGRVIVFRRVVGSKFFANASKCDEYVQESRAFFATPKLSYRSEQMQRYQELNTWFVDLWMGPL
jgi:hypothetical protein